MALEEKPVDTAADQDADTYTFTMARFIYAASLFVLTVVVTTALHPLIGGSLLAWPFAFLLAVVVVAVFGKLLHIAFDSHWLPLRVLAAVLALAVGTTTASLSSASLYGQFGALGSARADMIAKSDAALATVSQVVASATLAHGAIDAWRKDASEKKALEESKGGTCPARNAVPEPGPISAWRANDARLAEVEAADIDKLLQDLRSKAKVVVSLPPPKTWPQVKALHRASNDAIAAANLLTGKSYTAPALKSLGEAQTKLVPHRRTEFACGDTARVALIERAKRGVSDLQSTPPVVPLKLVVDGEDLSELAVRGWLRGGNLLLKMVCFGYCGQFEDDHLMKDALNKGNVNRETIPFLLSMLLELTTAVSHWVMRQSGRAPIQSNFVNTARAMRSSSTSGWSMVGHAALKAAVNVFFQQSPECSADQRKPKSRLARRVGTSTSSAPTHAQSLETQYAKLTPLAIESNDEQHAKKLLPYACVWEDKLFVVLPMTTTTRDELNAATVLTHNGMLTCLASGVRARAIKFAPHKANLEARLGRTWRKLRYAIYEVDQAAANSLLQPKLAG